MKIKLLFFGSLVEAVGRNQLAFNAPANTELLLERLLKEYPQLQNYTFRLAINQEMVEAPVILNAGDEVALMPPFAGG